MEIKTKKTERILSLPEEIIEQILSRLPVKPLLKFRCVSHSWRSLIGSKKFIKTHLENSTKTTDFTHHRIIAKFPFSDDYLLKHCSVHSLLYEPVANGCPLDFGYPACNSEYVHVVGCCNGLICILVACEHFYLCNPSTRKFKKLPAIDDKISIRSIHISKYGFGYDECDDDYKVFGVLSMWHGVRYQGIGKIYSVKTNSWRKIENFRDPCPFERKGIFASGKLYWLMSSQSCSKWHIVSFDLTSEAYGIVEQPDNVVTRFPPGFGALDGRLYVLFDSEKIGLVLWVLKNNGVKECWDKLFSFKICDPWNNSHFRLITPLCIGSNGELLLICNGAFVVYNPKDDRFVLRQTTNFDVCSEVGAYVESLVEVACDDEQE